MYICIKASDELYIPFRFLYFPIKIPSYKFLCFSVFWAEILYKYLYLSNSVEMCWTLMNLQYIDKKIWLTPLDLPLRFHPFLQSESDILFNDIPMQMNIKQIEQFIIVTLKCPLLSLYL